jgi:superfamily II RNA helicase
MSPSRLSQSTVAEERERDGTTESPAGPTPALLDKLDKLTKSASRRREQRSQALSEQARDLRTQFDDFEDFLWRLAAYVEHLNDVATVERLERLADIWEGSLKWNVRSVTVRAMVPTLSVFFGNLVLAGVVVLTIYDRFFS